MNTARLKQIEEIYHSAADKTPTEREEFVRAECGDDENLRREVISLLSYEEISDSFIDTSPDSIFAEMLSGEDKVTLIGKTIGHYDIKQLLGLGGMGEVYLANDNLLNRKVALKLVPPDLAELRINLNRFKQEAKAASALNHPNILTIHEFGAEDGAQYIVSEFVDGVTLRQRIKDSVPSGKEILDIAGQVASALAAAHGSGIVHRDIKPENIMIRRDGIVKVLDFGLAKLTMPAGSEMSKEDQTLFKTAPGSVIGTAAYMSPEQARGVEVDSRTDIWSLGVVLYEMLTGHRPFDGDTQTDVLVAILNQPVPALADFAVEAPPELRRMIDKALAKNVEDRYRVIEELASDLRSLKARLEFEAELQHSQSDRSAASDLQANTPEPATQLIPALDPATLPGKSTPDTSSSSPGKTRSIVFASVVALVVVAGMIGAVVWKSNRSDSPSGPPEAADRSNAPDTVAARQPRKLTYSLTVQSYTDGRYKDPFRLSGEMLFRNRDRVRINVKSPQAGHLYILNQGPQGDRGEPSYNILFPSSTTNDGSALLAADQQIQIPQQSWFELDAKEGTELVWLVWSESAIPDIGVGKTVRQC